MSGLTVNGFQRKRLADIKLEIEERLRSELGASINLTPPSVLATIVGIYAEREGALWQLAEDIYNSSYPDTAEGTSLDNVVAITGITRQAATKSTLDSLYLKGTSGTTISSGTQFSVDGNPDAVFESTAAVTLSSGTDEVQDVTFSATPASGSFRLVFEDEQTALIAFNDTATKVQTELNNLNDLSGVVVSGSYAAGFTISFQGDDGKLPQPLLTIADNTLSDGSAVSVTVTETTAGVPQGTANVEAIEAGAKQALARTLTQIDTPVTGLNSVINLKDATIGRDRETDLELRKRRGESLQVAGAGTVEAIVSALRNVTDVTAVVVIENDTDAVDADGRPAHSFEAVVSGGNNQEIGDELWEVKGGGIRAYGSISVNVTDSQGIVQVVEFSRPTQIDIYVIVNVTTNGDFPANGADAVEDAILERAAEKFGIGDAVIPIPTLICALDNIEGIIDAELFVGKSASPTLDDPISIAIDEIASFDSSRITVNVT